MSPIQAIADPAVPPQAATDSAPRAQCRGAMRIQARGGRQTNWRAGARWAGGDEDRSGRRWFSDLSPTDPEATPSPRTRAQRSADGAARSRRAGARLEWELWRRRRLGRTPRARTEEVAAGAWNWLPRRPNLRLRSRAEVSPLAAVGRRAAAAVAARSSPVGPRFTVWRYGHRGSTPSCRASGGWGRRIVGQDTALNRDREAMRHQRAKADRTRASRSACFLAGLAHQRQSASGDRS